MTTTTAETTTKARFEKALHRVQGVGVHVQINVMTCCPSCATMKDVGLSEGSTVPYAWTFGGQGRELVWRTDTPYYREEEESPESLCGCYEAEYDENDDGEEVLVAEEYICEYCEYGTEPERQERVARGVYFYHGSLRAAEAVADAFYSEGFQVEWSRSADEAVYVKF